MLFPRRCSHASLHISTPACATVHIISFSLQLQSHEKNYSHQPLRSNSALKILGIAKAFDIAHLERIA